MLPGHGVKEESRGESLWVTYLHDVPRFPRAYPYFRQADCFLCRPLTSLGSRVGIDNASGLYVTGHLSNTFPNFVLIIIITCDLLEGSQPHSLVQSFSQSHGEKPTAAKTQSSWWPGTGLGMTLWGTAQACCSGPHIPVGYRRGYAPLHGRWHGPSQ